MDKSLKKHKEMLEIKEKLLQYAGLMLDEFGECCERLCELHDRIEYANSKKLQKVLEKVIKEKLVFFETNYIIEQRTETHTIRDYVLIEKD